MTDKDRLVNKLKIHDWWYEHSDDRKAFLRGLAERADIYELVCKLPGPEIQPILLKYVPEDCQDAFAKALFAFNRSRNFLKEHL